MNTSRSRSETTSSSASCTGLSRSELRERFVLKGAMLLRLWADQPYRATVDLDLLSRGNPDPDSVARDIAAICRTGVPDDAVVFDASTIRTARSRICHSNPESGIEGALSTQIK